MAKLLTYDGQVIDPTAYIYIYMVFDQFATYILAKRNIFCPVS